MKNNLQLIISVLMIQLVSEYANAGNIISGIKSLTDMVTKIGMALSVLAIVAAGIMFYKNQQIGSEKLMSALTGTIIVASAVAISGLIYQMFS